ncbi:MAG: ADP-ribosylglycohydrolase family protein, partial [Verrucomicrobiota bacterium]
MGGCLVGGAVGDALGLPAEGLSRKRLSVMFPGPCRHRFFFRRGMFSDDTEHSVMVSRALLKNPDDAAAFQRSLAWSLRWWLLGLPAGVGLATARSLVKLWLGVPLRRAGVFSAGNGPAMRSAILGVVFRDDDSARERYVRASSQLTHSDPRAEEGAALVAEAAAMAAESEETGPVLERLREMVISDEMKSRLKALESALDTGGDVLEFAAAIGCEKGVSGFAPNTVAVALFAWLRHRNDFAMAMSQTIRCGGDVDTVAA